MKESIESRFSKNKIYQNIAASGVLFLGLTGCIGIKKVIDKIAFNL